MAIEFSLLPPIDPKVLFAPNIPKISELANGNTGIADSIKKANLIKNLSTINDLESLKIFVKLNKVSLPKDFDSYVKDGLLRIPPNDVKFELAEDKNGFKALEITTIKAIFETQKPYMEIVAILCKSLVGIEDLIARTLALADLSLKPATNKRALGFQFSSFSSDVNTLQNFNDKDKQSAGTKDTNYFDKDLNTNPTTSQGSSAKSYQILGTEYSTGDFDPTVNYEYIYHDIEESSLIEDNKRVNNVDTIDKPNVVCFGIYNSEGIQIIAPDWLQNSGKWYGQFPQVGSFEYIWKRDEETIISLGIPDPDEHGNGWENTEEKVFNQSDTTYYQEYYQNLIDVKLAKRPNISDADKNDIRDKINSKIDISSQLNSVSSGGFITDFEPSLFSKNNSPLLPKQISFSGSNVYVDGESDYDLKFIKVDSTLDINYTDNIGKVISTKIQRFLLNTYTLKFSDDSLFDANISQNNFTTAAGVTSSNITLGNTNIVGVNNILMDNLTNNFEYIIDIVKRTSPDSFKQIFWKESNSSDFKLNTPSFKLETDEQSANFHYIFKETSTNKWRYTIYNAKSAIDQTDGVNRFTNKINTIPVGSTIKDGVYKIPGNFNRIVVKSGYVYGWVVKPITIKISDLQNKTGIIASSNLNFSENVVDLQSGSIRVDSNDNRFGKIINTNQIKNDQLKTDKPYSDKEYGDNVIEQLFRYRTSIDDTETFYILEGKIQTDEQENLLDTNTQTTINKKYYRKPHALAVPKKFVDIFMPILIELIPAINQLLSLIKNPTNFISEILKNKLGENFEVFSPAIIKKFQELAGMDPLKRFAFVENNPDLKKYISANKLGDYMFVLDGQAIINFLDIKFGLELKKLKITLIFDTLKQLSNLNNNGSNSASSNNGGINTHNGPANTLDNIAGIPSTEKQTSIGPNGQVITEDVSVIYSTGKKIDGINYKYTYLTETVISLIAQSDDFVKAGDLEGALPPLMEAYSIDPKNDFVRDRLESLKNKIKKSVQPLLDFLLNIVTMPIKIVLAIITYIKSIFEDLNIATIAQTIKEFITFEWIKKFVSKDFILGLLGIKADFNLLKEWKKSWETYPDSYIFDLSQVFSAPFLFQLPKVPKSAINYLFMNLCEIMNSVLAIIEGIINAVIDLIWAPLTLDALIPQPYVKLTQPCFALLNTSIDIDKLFNLLNAGNGSNGDLNQFAFFIKTSDGRSLSDLNRDELEEFIKNNQNLNFKFDF